MCFYVLSMAAIILSIMLSFSLLFDFCHTTSKSTPIPGSACSSLVCIVSLMYSSTSCRVLPAKFFKTSSLMSNEATVSFLLHFVFLNLIIPSIKPKNTNKKKRRLMPLEVLSYFNSADSALIFVSKFFCIACSARERAITP
ncbi:MAG: hypothetical protein PWP45_1898 [Tepidanaerobacteraceae bacterium]|nr:hypothetical protein [Tepidanaerobacteraceae bacterium]